MIEKKSENEKRGKEKDVITEKKERE